MSSIQRSNELDRSQSGSPLDQLPPALVTPAAEFYAFFSDSLKGVTGLAFRLSWWMKPTSEGGEGLTVDDAIAAMRKLMRPEKAGSAEYAGQVQAALCAEIMEVLKRRRAKQDLERIKRETGYPAQLTDKIGVGGDKR